MSLMSNKVQHMIQHVIWDLRKTVSLKHMIQLVESEI